MLSGINICVKVGGTALLRHVEVHVAPGEVVALLGENGAGKSTLLNVLAGDVRPHTGSVRMNGRPLYLWSMRDRAKVRAVMLQDPPVPVGFCALEAVLFGRYPHAGDHPGLHDEAIARAAMETTRTWHLRSRTVATLSGGERARVMLAKTLAQVWEPWRGEPRYLLLDEPTASLDLAHQQRALETVRAFVRNGEVGACAVLHDLNLAARYADRVVLLKAGVPVVTGTPAEALTARHLAESYGVDAIVMAHPRTGAPLIVTA